MTASGSDASDGYPAVAPRPSAGFSVFISYRHVEPDRTWAKWLHSALETYRVPRRLMQELGLPRRIGQVFRDEEELAASSDLGAGIRESLDRSKYLIVVCSPRTPSSQWIGAEVEYFRQQGRGDAILALLIEGEPSEAFPAALATIRPRAMRQLGPTEALETVEPLAADVRPDSSEGSRYRKRMAKLRLLAAVLHCRFDQLRQREQERRIRSLGLAIGGLAILTTIVLGLGVLAELNREHATAERDHALQSQSLLLADFAHREIDQGNAVTGMLLAIEALPRDVQRPDRPVVSEAVEALYDGLLARRELAILRVGSEIESASMSADGQQVLTVTKSGVAQLWDRSGSPVATLGNPGESVRFARFSPDSTRIVTGSAAGPSRIWDGKLGTLVSTISTSPKMVVGFSPDGKRFIGSATDGTWLWDAESGKEVATIAGEVMSRPTRKFGSYVSFPLEAFSADGSLLLTFSRDQASAILWDAASGERLATFQDSLPMDGATLSADGSTVLTWSGLSGGKSSSARLWSVARAAPFLLIREPFLDALFRPDGAQVVTSSGVGPVRLWDAKSGREIAHLANHSFPELVFSPDLQRLVMVPSTGSAQLFDTATGAKIADLDWTQGVRFNPAAKRLVTFGGRAVLWDGVNGRQIAILRHEKTGRGSHIIGDTSGVTNAAEFTKDGERVVTAGEDGSARLWNAADGSPIAVLRAHMGPVTDAMLSRDGGTVLTRSDDKTVRLWDAHDGPEVTTLRGHRGEIKKLEVAQDGIVTAGKEDGTVRLWDLRTGRKIAVLGGDEVGKLVDAALDTSGEYVVTPASDGTARVWKTADGAAVAVLRGRDKSVLQANFSPDGTRVLTVGDDRTVRLWRVPSGEALTVLRHDGAVTSARFCANGASIVTLARGRTGRQQGEYIVKAYLWDAGSGQQIARMDGPDSDVSTIAVTQNGARVLVGYQNGAGRLWDCRDGTTIADLPQQEDEVTHAEFIGNDQRLITGDHLYAADLSREIARFDGHSAFVTRDGNRIMTLSSNGYEPAHIWNGVTGERISTLVGDTNLKQGGALSAGGDRALTFSDMDGTARLWDTDTGRQLALLRCDDRIDRVAFSPDGAHVLLASHDGTIWIFPVYPSTTALFSHARAVIPRAFTPEERQSLGLAELK